MNRTSRAANAARNDQPEQTPDTSTVDAAQESTEATASAEATPAKRVRNPVEVGTVTIGASTREIRSNRPSKLDTNPVAVAVRDAEPGQQYEIKFDEGKSDAIISVLRRAGGYYKRGVNILAVIDKPEVPNHEPNGEPTPAERVIVFAIGERRVRKQKGDKPAETPADTEPEQWAGPTHEAPTE
jgi:hypothetical protein